MANYTDMQMKMRAEVDSIIGDRMATHEDRNACHYVNAFITEALRFRGVVPLGVPHKAFTDYKLGNYCLKLNLFIQNMLCPFYRKVAYWDLKQIT